MTANNFRSSSKAVLLLVVLLILFGFDRPNKSNMERLDHTTENVKETFEEDYSFLKAHDQSVKLLNSGKSRVAVSPALQGRVMTSSANGMQGSSYGWINKTHYESGEINPKINVYGGEERFWLGPEGGQYSIFFKEGQDFVFENWVTPRLIDLDPFEIVDYSDSEISFVKEASLINYSNFEFSFRINRTVGIIPKTRISKILQIDSIEGVDVVGYHTRNTLKNIGEEVWTKENGLLSIWILGMYKPSTSTTVVIPYLSDDEKDLGQIVNVYESFGEIADDRLRVRDNLIYFKGDGQYRSKIGLSPNRAKDILGSYDSENAILTIVKYNKPEDVTDYVNSKWEFHKNPYQGDVLNSYNDGPLNGGEALGPFYELETSSPAVGLAPGEAITHVQHTFHFEGDKAILNQIALATLGVSLEEIDTAFD